MEAAFLCAVFPVSAHYTCEGLCKGTPNYCKVTLGTARKARSPNWGLNENAARMRVDRALDKLQSLLAKRGITSTASGLAMGIVAGAIESAPTGLAASVATGALAATATTSTNTFTILKLMSMTKLKAGIISLVVAGVGSSFVIQHQAQVKLREENVSLRLQVEQLAQMTAENELLSIRIEQERASRSLSNDQRNELMRLRREVGELRKQQQAHDTARTAAGSQGAPTAEAASEAVSLQTIPRESWAFVGYATPENALQSVVWAMSRGDLSSFLAGLSPETQRAYANRFEGKTQAEIATRLNEDIGQLPALRLDRKKVSGDDAVTFVLYSEERDNGTTKTRDEAVMTFKIVGSEWKLDERQQSGSDPSLPDTVR